MSERRRNSCGLDTEPEASEHNHLVTRSEGNCECQDSDHSSSCSDADEDADVSRSGLRCREESAEELAVRKLLCEKLCVLCSDGRVFVGCFSCTDKDCNVILSNAATIQTLRMEGPTGVKLSKDVRRHVGSVFVPGEHVVRILHLPKHKQQTSGSSAGDDDSDSPYFYGLHTKTTFDDLDRAIAQLRLVCSESELHLLPPLVATSTPTTTCPSNHSQLQRALDAAERRCASTRDDA